MLGLGLGISRRRGLLSSVALPPGTVEPPDVISPSVGATSPSPRQKVIKKGALLSDSISLSAPAQTGSALVLVVAANGPAVINTPSGWTALTGATQQTGEVTQHIFGRANAGGVQSVSWTSASGTATAATAYLTEIQDCHTTAPFIESVKAVGNVSTLARTTGAATGAALTYDNTLVLAFAAVDAGASVDATTTRGFSDSFTTEIFSASNTAAPAVAMGSRLYPTAVDPFNGWRLLISAVNGGTEAEVMDIQFRTVAGQNQPPSGGASFASSVYNSSYNHPYAFDNNNTTQWGSATGQFPASIGYNYPAANAAVEVMVQAANAAYAPKDFLVQSSSDGVTWTTRLTVTNQTGWVYYQQRTFSIP